MKREKNESRNEPIRQLYKCTAAISTVVVVAAVATATTASASAALATTKAITTIVKK